MHIHRREFLKFSAGAAGAALLASACSSPADHESASYEQMKTLKSMTGDVVPIKDEERWDRIEQARRLMISSGIKSIYLEAGQVCSISPGSDGVTANACSSM